MFDKALRGIPRCFATSSWLSPTYSQALLSRSPSAALWSSGDCRENPTRSSSMVYPPAFLLIPNCFCLGQQVADTIFRTDVSSSRRERCRQLEAKLFLDSADQFDCHER